MRQEARPRTSSIKRAPESHRPANLNGPTKTYPRRLTSGLQSASECSTTGDVGDNGLRKPNLVVWVSLGWTRFDIEDHVVSEKIFEFQQTGRWLSSRQVGG